MRQITPLLALPGKDPEAEGDRQFVTALARGLEVLRAFGEEGRPLSNAELAQRTGLPKATISRLTYTLSRMGYLEHLPKLERYRPGSGVLALGYPFVVSNPLRQAARPLLTALAEHANASVAISARDRLSMVYREARHASGLMGVRLDVGARIPIASSAAGMAVLHVLEGEERRSVLEALEAQVGADWPSVAARVSASAEELEQQGFCIVRGGVFEDSLAVAVPYRPADGGPALAFNCAAPAYLMSEDAVRSEIGPRLRDIVVALGSDAGGQRR